MDLITKPDLFFSIRPDGPRRCFVVKKTLLICVGVRGKVTADLTSDVWHQPLLYVFFELVVCFHHCTSSSFPAGIWECQDRPQQQLQSLWQIHSGELPGERHCERVSKQHFHSSIERKSIQALLLISRAYVEKYLLEKSRLVYQEHNERWEKHDKRCKKMLRSCGGAVQVDVRMHKQDNSTHVSVCVNDFCCLDSNFSLSVTSVASGSLFGFAYFWSMKWVALSGPDTNVLDQLGRSGEGYPRHGGLTVGLLSSSPLIEMNCWLQGHKIIWVCICVCLCVVGLCSHSCCTGLTFNLCAAA